MIIYLEACGSFTSESIRRYKLCWKIKSKTKEGHIIQARQEIFFTSKYEIHTKYGKHVEILPVGKFPIYSISDGASRYPPSLTELGTISAPISEAVKEET